MAGFFDSVGDGWRDLTGGHKSITNQHKQIAMLAAASVAACVCFAFFPIPTILGVLIAGVLAIALGIINPKEISKSIEKAFS